jgi:hypothetical protein
MVRQRTVEGSETSRKTMTVTIHFPPVQAQFDEDGSRAMNMSRRQFRTEWPEVLHKPASADKNWSAVLPFPNTYENAFQTMCPATRAHSFHSKHDRLYLFLNGTEGHEEPPEEVTRWVETISKPVVMKDLLALSFALDYDREGGNPQKPQAEIGKLRSQAKPYGGAEATNQTLEAADNLAHACVSFLTEMTCYDSANCVVAMPPSEVKPYNLPYFLADRVADLWGRENLTERVRTITARQSIKGLPLAQKLDTLLGTIEVNEDAFKGKRVLLIDDLYQSGISMNYCGLLLLKAGAKKIFGLACEKTCRNDDNVSGRM